MLDDVVVALLELSFLDLRSAIFYPLLLHAKDLQAFGLLLTELAIQRRVGLGQQRLDRWLAVRSITCFTLIARPLHGSHHLNHRPDLLEYSMSPS